MNFLELINKCLLELNYKQVSSFAELVKNDHKKIPMFGDNNTVNKNNTKNSNNTTHKFEFSAANIKPYNVRNSEHQKMLVDLRGLVDYYMNIFSEEDLKKILFLIDKLKNEL
jgi:hypothetical protein